MTFSNAPANSVDGAPMVKLKGGVRLGRFVAYAALSHKDKVSEMRFEYPESRFSTRAEQMNNGDIRARELTVPITLRFLFNGKRCRVVADVGFSESSHRPDCD